MIDFVTKEINTSHFQFSIDDYVNCIIHNKGVFIGQVKWSSKLISGEWKQHFLEITNTGSLIHSVNNKDIDHINSSSTSMSNLLTDETGISLASSSIKHAIIKNLQGSTIKIIRSRDTVPIIHIKTSSSSSVESNNYYLKVFSTSKFKELLIVLTWWSSMKPASLYNKLSLFKNHTLSNTSSTKKENPTKYICQLNVLGPIPSSNKHIYVNNNNNTTEDGYKDIDPKTLAFFENKKQGMYKWFSAIGTIDCNGTIKLLSQIDGSLIYSIDSTTLLRSEIRCVDPSLITIPDSFCIFLSENSRLRKKFKMNSHFKIYESNHKLYHQIPFRDILLGFPSKTDMIQWYSSLSSFAIDEKLSLSYMDTSNQLRISNSLNICILEASLENNNLDTIRNRGLHVEILLNGKIIAKTSIVYDTNVPFWREDFTIQEIIPIYELKFRIVNNVYDSTKLIKSQLLSEIKMNQRMLETKKYNTEVRVPLYDIKDDHTRLGSLCLKIENNLQIILASNNYSKFESLLLRCPMDQMVKLIVNKLKENISLMEPMARIMLNIFQYYKRELDWFQNVIQYEMNGNDYDELTAKEKTYNSIFRGNSLFTISVEKYFDRIGEEYLFKSVGKIIKDLIDNHKEISLEIDPHRISLKKERGIDEQLRSNEKNLLYWLERLWNIIATTSNDVPTEMKYILKLIRQQLEMKFLDRNKLQEVTLHCVSSVLFLRFFCPIILNPQLFKLVHGNCSELMRRNLTILSKILLNFSALTFFGMKEKWLTSMNNKFIDKHKNELIDYVEKLTEKKLDFTPKKFKINYPKITGNNNDNSEGNGNNIDNRFLIDIQCNETELIKILNNNNINYQSNNKKQDADNIRNVTIGTLEFEDITKDNTEIFGDEFKSRLQINDDSKEDNGSNSTVVSNTEEIKQEYTLLDYKINHLISVFEKNEYPSHNITNNKEYIEKLCHSLYLQQSVNDEIKQSGDIVEIVIDMQGINKYEKPFFNKDNVFRYDNFCTLDEKNNITVGSGDNSLKTNPRKDNLNSSLQKDKSLVNNKNNKSETVTRNNSKKRFSYIASFIVGNEADSRKNARDGTINSNDSSSNGISRWFSIKK